LRELLLLAVGGAAAWFFFFKNGRLITELEAREIAVAFASREIQNESFVLIAVTRAVFKDGPDGVWLVELEFEDQIGFETFPVTVALSASGTVLSWANGSMEDFPLR